MTRLANAAAAVLLAGCGVIAPSGRFVCEGDADCPPDQRCMALGEAGGGLCYAEGDAPDQAMAADRGVDDPPMDDGPLVDGGMMIRPDLGGMPDAGVDFGVDGGVDGGVDLGVDAGGIVCSPTCEAPAFCDAVPGNPLCQCDEEGYESPPAGETACVDIDECAEETDNCADDATCENTDGSFTCACDCGFSGDGVTCAPSSNLWGTDARLISTQTNTSNFLFAVKVRLTQAGRVLSYRTRIGDPNSASLVMGVYSDTANAPDRLLGQSRATVLISGEVALTPSASCLELDAGSYWVVALSNRSYTIGSDGGRAEDVVFAARTYSPTLPSRFPTSPSRTMGARMNLYLETD